MRELWQKIQHGLDRLSGRLINGLIEEWNDAKREARAIGRVLVSGIGLVPFVYGLAWVHRHAPADKPVGFMLAGLALIVFGIVLQRLGNGRGLAHGFWLWLVSLGWVIALALATIALGATLAWMSGESVEWGGVIGLYVIGCLLGNPCEKALKHAEEQTP